MDTGLSVLRHSGTWSLLPRQEQPTAVTFTSPCSFPARLLVITQKLYFSITSSPYPPRVSPTPSPRPALGLQNEMQD